MFFKSHYLLMKYLHVFLIKNDSKIVRRQRLGSYSRQNKVISFIQRCKQQKTTAIKTTKESHLYWKNYFHKNLLCFWIYVEFEADIEIDDFDKRKND